MQVGKIECYERDLELDPLSELTVTYTEDGFKELLEDINTSGQLVPIVLRKGKILDGRHRYKVCKELGIPVNYTEVGNVSDKKALDIVISNAINKSIGTDSSKVEAFVMCRAAGIKNSEMPKRFKRLNSNYVSKIAYIEKCNPEYLKVLLRQNKVSIYSKEFNTLEDYGTINGLWRVLKGNDKLKHKVTEVVTGSTEEIDYKVNVEEYFGNPAAEDEYWDIFNQAKQEGINVHPASQLGRKIASLVKSKYSKE